MAGRLISEDSDEEFQEIQLNKLQNNYRHAREDQREYTIEKKDQLRMQSKTLQQLAKEREELNKVYRLAESLENQKRDEEKTKKLRELIQTKDEIQNEIQDQQALTSDLDVQLREWEKKIRQQQTDIGGANASITFIANVRKQERVLENRLDTALKRFSALLASNSLLRSEIDNLRNERERYENLSRKSENELRDLRAQLVESIERSVTSYEQRKDANAKAIMLQNKAEADRTISEAEMRELERQISHDRKLRDFMKLKSQERQEDEELLTHRKRKEAEALEKRRKEKEEHSVEAYESKFKKIQDISREQDLDKLVDKFIEVEDKNFALFNYVNELNNQIEILQEQIAEIKKEIHRFEVQGVDLEDQRKKTLDQLEEKSANATRLADEHEEKSRTGKKILEQCRGGIDSIFRKIGCDRRQIESLLQSHEGVTEENMLRYLGIIEERTNELLMAQAATHAKEQNVPLRERAPNLIGDGPSGPAPHVHVHLPNTDDRRDHEDREEKTEELKPLTREELKQRAIDHVKNLEKKALQEQKYPDMSPALSREKSITGGAKSTSGETGKPPTSRGR
ncbi:unnamed protein product [Rotaria socialis]|uniref:ODAD1 central coiled coil region domain-containing protein n=1 Tax=Rotaria socialis TaxID=392032 RepID=A0A819VM86_9BILA|nr:unnamed protein product [Rotaria socialis]CAF3466586.1 unnamed protein product [Rotaria socialis]CAF4111391.1 unnamed protein product [Rotaria socialis]CAF4122109.1 unnamed protein product [Rotaria socialis]CAF4283758.1 unnamed protein product [Rotaria socialis]